MHTSLTDKSLLLIQSCLEVLYLKFFHVNIYIEYTPKRKTNKKAL